MMCERPLQGDTHSAAVWQHRLIYHLGEITQKSDRRSPCTSLNHEAKFISWNRPGSFRCLTVAERERQVLCYSVFPPLVFTGLRVFFVWGEREMGGGNKAQDAEEKSDIRMFYFVFEGVFDFVALNPLKSLYLTMSPSPRSPPSLLLLQLLSSGLFFNCFNNSSDQSSHLQ